MIQREALLAAVHISPDRKQFLWSKQCSQLYKRLCANVGEAAIFPMWLYALFKCTIGNDHDRNLNDRCIAVKVGIAEHFYALGELCCNPVFDTRLPQNNTSEERI